MQAAGLCRAAVFKYHMPEPLLTAVIHMTTCDAAALDDMGATVEQMLMGAA